MIATVEAARRLGIQPHTLRVWRLLGRGPRYVRYGGAKTGRCYYAAEDIDAFKAARCFTSTAGETIAAVNPPSAEEAAAQPTAG
jgi:transposase-like protein